MLLPPPCQFLFSSASPCFLSLFTSFPLCWWYYFAVFDFLFVYSFLVNFICIYLVFLLFFSFFVLSVMSFAFCLFLFISALLFILFFLSSMLIVTVLRSSSSLWGSAVLRADAKWRRCSGAWRWRLSSGMAVASIQPKREPFYTGQCENLEAHI